MAGAVEGDLFIGKRAQELRGLLKIKYPIEHGIVQDWDDMEKIWQFIYTDELKTMSEEVGEPFIRTQLCFPSSPPLATSYKRLWVYGKVWGMACGCECRAGTPTCRGVHNGKDGALSIVFHMVRYHVQFHWHVDIMRAALEWSDHPLDNHSAQKY
jgi:hypothetical protein